MLYFSRFYAHRVYNGMCVSGRVREMGLSQSSRTTLLPVACRTCGRLSYYDSHSAEILTRASYRLYLCARAYVRDPSQTVLGYL